MLPYDKKMLLESRIVISLLSILILLISFVASFKYQDASLFFLGLIASILVNRCDRTTFMNISKNKEKNKNENENEKKNENGNKKNDNTKDKKMNRFMSKFTADVPSEDVPSEEVPSEDVPSEEVPSVQIPETEFVDKAPIVDKSPSSEPPEKIQPKTIKLPSDIPIQKNVFDRLKNVDIDYIEDYSLQRKVYGYGRPTLGEISVGRGNLSKLTPNFVLFAHTLVGNVRDPAEPEPAIDNTIEQNPELLKLVEPGSGMVAKKDYFPSCRDSLPYHAKQDPRSASRCRVTGIY